MNSSTITAAPHDRLSTTHTELKPLPKWMQRIDQTEKASFVIDAWIALDPHSQNTFLAQLIAATLHDGPETALGIFAATARLDAGEALVELNAVVVPLEREPWVDLLGHYIINVGGRS
ncbi:hypothetical protein [uncultured Microbacterium sp.]|uniref:hypothetical protein n=1 Tax=uncultured Microbacterium sp. TaxID=191216 RepID=UPI0026248C16|nr:hypothetical protein [uncultured Microbacterium sp.]